MPPGWPAERQALERARAFLLEVGGQPATLVCDSDVDGLASAVIVQRTLERRGARVQVLPVHRGEHAHSDSVRQRVAGTAPAAVVVLDLGSRPAPLGYGVPTLIIDHHHAGRGVPADALVVNGYERDPVAPASVLAYLLCRPLAEIGDSAWLAALGAVADLGTAAPFGASIPVSGSGGRTWRTAVGLLNAARRAPHPDPAVALDLLRRSSSVADLLSGRHPAQAVLEEARQQVRAEVARCSRVAPAVRPDVALIRFSSKAQVHPLIATRWAPRLTPRVVIAANDGYLAGRTNFAVRSQSGRDLVDWLRTLGFEPGSPGEYANGHARASGGSLVTEDFERFLLAAGFEDADAQPRARTRAQPRRLK